MDQDSLFSQWRLVLETIYQVQWGLGILAGDTIKSSVDLNPLFAVSLIYYKGTFKQDIDDHGFLTVCNMGTI